MKALVRLTVLMNECTTELKMVLVAFHVQVNRLYLKHSTRRITKLGSGEGLRTLQLWQSAKIYPLYFYKSLN